MCRVVAGRVPFVNTIGRHRPILWPDEVQEVQF